MITQEFLVEAGLLAHDAWKRTGHRLARHRYVQAERSLDWMRAMNLTEIKQVGMFGGTPLTRGQMAIVPKGTVIRTMDPRYDSSGGIRIARRDTLINVFDIYEGYVDSHWHSHKIAAACRNETVVWPGSGGYWCHADTADITTEH